MLDDARIETDTPSRFSTFDWRIASLLAIVVLGLYAPAIGGSFIWDDPDYLINNASLRTLGGLWRIWTDPTASPQYYPLVFSSFWLEYHLWGLWPAGYHVINVLLHLGSALLIWRIMDRLNLRGGWLAAAIFALHPVHVESVAWVSERKNVLSSLFYLLALNVYLPSFTWRRWTVALLLFIAALLSKSVTATWPAAVLVIAWWRDGRFTARDVVRLLPFFLLGIASGGLTSHIEHSLVGASGTQIGELNFSIADRFLIAGRAIWFYVGKLLMPWPLTFIYPRWKLDPHMAWQWTYPVAIFLLIAVTFIWSIPLSLVLGGEGRGEGPSAASDIDPEVRRAPHPSPLPGVRGRGRNTLAIILLFIGTLLPALGFINVYPMRYSFVADHFQYLASIALIVPAAAFLTRRGKYAAIALLPLAILTFIRAGIFAAPLPLWTDTYAKNPSSWMVCTNLANALAATGNIEAAGDKFLEAYDRSPQLYETQTNAAIVLARRGQTPRGLALLDSSEKLNPHFPFTFYYRGMILENSGDFAGAATNYRHALDLAGTMPIARQRLDHVEQTHPQSSTQSSGDALR